MINGLFHFVLKLLHMETLARLVHKLLKSQLSKTDAQKVMICEPMSTARLQIKEVLERNLYALAADLRSLQQALYGDVVKAVILNFVIIVDLAVVEIVKSKKVIKVSLTQQMTLLTLCYRNTSFWSILLIKLSINNNIS